MKIGHSVLILDNLKLGNTIENNNLKTNNMIQKEMAAKLHASEIRADIDYPQMSSKIWSHVKSEQERAFLAGFDYSNRWYLVEKLPKNYNCQILVKKENENFCDLRFFHHEEQFKLLCSIHKYTHWRPIF